MALFKEAHPKKTKENKEEKKQNKVIVSITQVFRNLSISVNLTVYTIYLLYLVYSIYAEVGIKAINFALALVTAAFMVVYLVLRLSSKRRGKQLREIKRYYKSFKLLARTVSAIIAVYALATAVKSVSPLALIISAIGAVFLLLRLIVDFILSLILKKIRSGKNKNKKDDDGDEGQVVEDEEANTNDFKHRMKRRMSRKVPKYRRNKDEEKMEDIIIPVDQCLLNDIDE